jgi:hypothetical protein
MPNDQLIYGCNDRIPKKNRVEPLHADDSLNVTLEEDTTMTFSTNPNPMMERHNVIVHPIQIVIPNTEGTKRPTIASFKKNDGVLESSMEVQNVDHYPHVSSYRFWGVRIAVAVLLRE